MQFDSAKFYEGFRAAFGTINEEQVRGLDTLLTAMQADAELTDVRHAAYMLATVKHECADTFLPIIERGSEGYFNRRYGHRTDLGNLYEGDGARYRGRGYVQITGRANYGRFSPITGCDLLAHPEKALEPEIAYQIMSHGMREGNFTGRGLFRYINDTGCDYVEARRIINGTDKAHAIARYAEKFETILRGALL